MCSRTSPISAGSGCSWRDGRDLGGRLHAILETGLAADCVKFDIDADGNLDMIRPSFGGKSLAHILCKKHRPQMASVRRNVFVAPPHNPDRRGEIVHERVELSPQDLDAKLLEFDEFTKEGGLRPEEADIVVSGGYGLGDRSEERRVGKECRSRWSPDH